VADRFERLRDDAADKLVVVDEEDRGHASSLPTASA
jgi:hypothetical protein